MARKRRRRRTSTARAFAPPAPHGPNSPDRSDVSVRASRSTLGILLSRWILWLDRKGAGAILRRVLPWLVAVVPILQGTGLIHGWYIWALVGAFLLAYGLQSALEAFRETSALALLMERFAEINGALGGSIASLANDLRSGCQVLDESECRYLCAGLLHRIRDFTVAALPGASTPRFRATLAVPLLSRGVDEPEALRVWCYDSTHPDRQWTRLAMDWPGAPHAYRTREVQIIPDVNALRQFTQLTPRRYRSIICIPISPAADVPPVAVLNIDADAVGYFDSTLFLSHVNPLIIPAVQLIGMVLLSRKEGIAYEFGK